MDVKLQIPLDSTINLTPGCRTFVWLMLLPSRVSIHENKLTDPFFFKNFIEKLLLLLFLEKIFKFFRFFVHRRKQKNLFHQHSAEEKQQKDIFKI
jgi:hypothetical protein